MSELVLVIVNAVNMEEKMKCIDKREQNKKEIALLIIYALGLSVLANTFILRLLPKVVSNMSNYIGY